MFSRREFLDRSLKTSSLIALGGAAVPGFLADTARAAEQGQENILVIVEMTGGNDGLNTVIPYADDLYHKARPTLRYQKNAIVRIDDHIGLHPALRPLDQLQQQGQLAIVQGIGYPNPNRSHFESMDIWQTGDPRGRTINGWLARALSDLQVRGGRIPALHLGQSKLPLALTGSDTGVPSLNSEKPFGLDLIGEFYGHQPDGVPRNKFRDLPDPVSTPQVAREATDRNKKSKGPGRKQLIQDLTRLSPHKNGLLQFVRKTSLDTYTTLDRLQEIMGSKFQVPAAQNDFTGGRFRQLRSGLQYELMLVAAMIKAEFGTRIFYVSIDGFDTHSSQKDAHQQLLSKLGAAIQGFFAQLESSGDAKRVVLMTYSEFGRRVRENGSKGTDHGSGSSMFVAGPAVNGGLIGEHPSLEPDQLDSGDLKHHTDFRRVYAALLDGWLGCDSRRVLGERFQPLELLKAKA